MRWNCFAVTGTGRTRSRRESIETGGGVQGLLAFAGLILINESGFSHFFNPVFARHRTERKRFRVFLCDM